MIIDILFLLGLFVGMFLVILFAEIYKTKILIELYNLPNRLDDLYVKIKATYNKISLALTKIKRYIKKSYEKAF